MEIDNVSIDKDIYFRHSRGKVNNLHLEFIKKIKEITGDSFFDKKENFEATYRQYPNEVCICGKDDCNETYLLRHIPSNKYIAVGSRCIDKVFDGFNNNVQLLKKNGKCDKCSKIIIKGGKNKNTEKNMTICNECNKCNLKQCIDCNAIIRDKKTYIIRCLSCYNFFKYGF